MLKRVLLGALTLALTGVGCKSTPTENPEGENPPIASGGEGTVPVDGADPSAGGDTAGATDGGGGSQTNVTTDDPNRFIGPEIAHSRGVKGGVVLLWPRVIPSSIAGENAQLAGQIQAHLKGTIERALPGKPIDVRPSPERVCPREGCEGMPINVLFNRNGSACLVVALIGGPGAAPVRLIPWAGTVEFKADTVPHREPPESQVVIKDYVPCDALLNAMKDNDSFVEAAIRSSAPAN
ncbi:MAG: hypothetical protein KC420_07705 [Myxococcales bacterium]|nr:hypothetical protein [Myxococcales bacterium]MCB9703567.1 hypothetical protein [Myxococcales bacterium]